MRREQLESIMNDTDLLDTLEIQGRSIELYRRNKVSNQKRQIESGTIQYPNLTELITNEVRHDYGRNTLDIVPYVKNMVSMLHDTYFVVTNSYYERNTRRIRLPFQTNDRLTIGLGLLYHRTNYTIEEDESYYYVTCDFDLYLDDRLMEAQNRIAEGEEYSLIAPGSGRDIPIFPERDSQLNTLQVNTANALDEAQQDTRRRGGTIPFSFQDHEAVNEYLATRQPHMKTRAMSRRHIPSAAKSCIAISKTLTKMPTSTLRDLERRKTELLRQDQLEGSMPPTWFTSSELTRYIRNQAVEDDYGYMEDPRTPELCNGVIGSRTNQKQSYYGNSTHWKKKDNLFFGIKGNSGKFIFARLISTGSNPGDLVSLMKSKMQERNYPVTNSLNLLTDNAIVDNYDYDSLEDVPSEMFRGLRLIRIGDCTTTGGGQNLYDYCTNIDGVYTLNIQRNIILRKGTIKMTLYGGQYRLCIPTDTYDIIQYTTLVSQTLEAISVEEIRDRLSFGSAPTDMVVNTKIKSRRITFGNNEVEAPTSRGSHSRLQLNSLSEEE